MTEPVLVRKLSTKLRGPLCTVLCCMLVACNAEEARRTRSNGVRARESVTHSESSSRSTTPARATEVRLDLAQRFEHADLRRGNAFFIDFGTRGAAKYTFGGWQTGGGRDVVLSGVTARRFDGPTARVTVPVASRANAELRLRASSARNGRVTLHLNGELLGDATVPTDGSFHEIAVPVAASLLEQGENTVQLRFGDDSLTLDWLRLGAVADSGGDTERTTIPRADGTSSTLTLPAGWSASFAFEAAEGARFVSYLRGARGARISVTAQRDAPASAVSVQRTLSSEEQTIDLDLARFSRDVVRLDLRADGGDVTLLEPRVLASRVRDMQSAPPKAQNAVVYLIDTLRADKLRPYNPRTRVRTPGLDRYVVHTNVLTRGYTHENWTKPSVATLLSSLLPWEHTATTGDAVVPSSVHLLSEVLEERGFTTAAFVANGYVSDKFGFQQGWDSFRNYIREGRRSQAQFVAADVLEWLDARRPNVPFFLYIHTIDPHVPYMPPRDVLALYDAEPYSGPVDFGKDRELLEKIKVGRLRLSERDKARLEALYDGEITHHDVHFAAIMDGLERRGLADDTIVVITADHGEEFFDHGSVGHGHSVHEELLHVPLFIRIPGMQPVRIDEPVGHVDVMPTVLEGLGIDVPREVTGHSLLPLLRGEARDAPAAVVSGFMDGWRTAVSGRYKLVQRTASNATLFDLASDPGEARDLAPGRPITLRYMRGLLGLALAGQDRSESSHRARSTTLDERTKAQLRALGYAN